MIPIPQTTPQMGHKHPGRSFVRSCFAEEASASIDSFNVFLSESSTDSEDEESTGPKVAFHIHRPPKAWRSKRVERRRKREPRWPVRPRGTVSAHKQLVVGVYHGRLTGSTSCGGRIFVLID